MISNVTMFGAFHKNYEFTATGQLETSNWNLQIVIFSKRAWKLHGRKNLSQVVHFTHQIIDLFFCCGPYPDMLMNFFCRFSFEKITTLSLGYFFTLFPLVIFSKISNRHVFRYFDNQNHVTWPRAPHVLCGSPYKLFFLKLTADSIEHFLLFLLSY